ncbi:uncharacterized protein LOC100122207 [Nasonia vitripennis]|uniref:EGF-like domain-containing protein n=1 Tax=Nasonia vitripennis TaxID=7425 RepID=A0A7M7T9J3_NASVI|nr:uncharacterized protein LOC100122207 [Nasonia vitripennis]
MAGSKASVLLTSLAALAFVGVLGIQNEQTRLRLAESELGVQPPNPSVRASTDSEEPQNLATSNLERTRLAPNLESSKRLLEDDELELFEPTETRYAARDQSAGLDEPIDALTASANQLDQIDGNQIEVKPGEYFRNIVPTKSESLSGEARGAPQVPHRHPAGPSSEPREQAPRQARRDQPSARIFSEHAPTAAPRQANPDIQDIITGIVKLLNGKVNVAVNSARPVRPVHTTRINNRGPPEIKDAPVLPSYFDSITPGMNPPPPPSEQPSTYETPPPVSQPEMPPVTPFLQGIPIPEAIVPQVNRPWNSRPSRPGTRRPVPPYKPLPNIAGSNVTAYEQSESDKVNAVIDLQNKIDPDENRTRLTSDHANHSGNHSRQQVSPTRKYQSTLKTDNPVAENTLVLGGVAPQPLPIPDSGDEPDKQKISATSAKPVFQTTLGVETSSSVQVIATTSTTTMLEPSLLPVSHSDFSESSSITSSDAPVTLEPSRTSTSSVDPSSGLSTPTEGLLSTSRIKSTNLPHRQPVQPITSSITFSKAHSSVYSYRPRPGIVLDDTLDYAGAQGIVTQRPYGGPPRHPNPDTFDVVVSAIQGPGGSGTGEVRVPVNGAHAGSDDILTSPVEGQGFVSIDGKRTYLNLFDNTEGTASASKAHVQPTRTQSAPVHGTGFAVPQTDNTAISPRPSAPVKRPTLYRRPTQPPVRIDTCIVGDSSTCDASQHEACATVQGVSACHCKPGFARKTHTAPCKKIVSIILSIRVDKIYDKTIVWTKDLGDKDSDTYHTLAYEANAAIQSAMSMTPFFDEHVGTSINNIYQGDVSQGQGGVFVNATLKLAYEPRTARPTLAGELQKHLLGVIQRRYNNIGSSALYVDSPAGSISNLQDLDECASSELNDCHSSATCTNTWGGFICTCNPGFKDPHKGDQSTSGRSCLSCPNSHCNNRGTCSYQGDQMQCSCTGNYYGAQCEVDGEVLGVAIGASVAALIIIVLTLVCLVMWSRRWSREQKAMSPVYGYVQGGLPGTLPARVGSVGTLASVKQGPPTNLPPYMWAQVADHLATANVYATEPMGPTRPSSAMFGYPTLSMHGTLPPVPLPRLQAPPRARQRHQPEPDSSDSEPQDKDRADLIPQSSFQVPRPKSRSSLANQSGIYYDVEYDQGDARHLSKNNIPMSTYSMAPYYRT